MKVKLTVWRTIGFDQSIVDVCEVVSLLRAMKKYSLPVKFMVEPYDPCNEEEQKDA